MYVATYLNRYSLPENKKALSMLHVCESKAFSILSISNHALTANSALMASSWWLSQRMRTQLSHRSMVRMYNAHTVCLVYVALTGEPEDDEEGTRVSPGKRSAI